MVAKIRVRWPDGAICGRCFTDAVRTVGRCAQCGEERLVPGRDNLGRSLCRDCAGIDTNMTCDTCGAEAERYRGGSCVRCVIRVDLIAILKPNDPPDLRLRRLIDVLADSGRPESIHTWMRGGAAASLLAQLGERTLRLDHEAFDALPRSAAVEHLRDLLTHHHILPRLEDKYIATFERWLARRLHELEPYPQVRSSIEQFATWHHLRRLRSADADTATVTAALAARQEITEAGKFLIWLAEEHQTDPADINQAQIDQYLAEGTSTRKHIRNYLHWLNHQRPRSAHVTAPYRTAQTTPLVTQDQRIRMVRNCLTYDNVALSTRVAALIHLLWAQPLNKIARLHTDAIELRPAGMRLHLAAVSSDIPEPIARLFWTHLRAPSNQRAGNTGTHWLFPGFRAGQPVHPNTLSQRFLALGINTQRVRNTTLRTLTQQLDAHSLANLLGYDAGILAEHARRGGLVMHTYPSVLLERSRSQRTPPAAPIQG
ncbi:hypothetical protein [Leifsonia shinshuensis]|uniref:Site-specific recombinase n=1 Tax=Leifsonia shinshuensis TaxID=150026 RepID=A0A7G6Y753_9MICO|nr:hypothetical protein [Leifsonia shinshuensis]QNE34318.1 hypothetical protein F1C12_03635 [Leifsonia shinshuensis]